MASKSAKYSEDELNEKLSAKAEEFRNKGGEIYFTE